MHPLLARTERVVGYLAAWLVVGILLALVLTGQGLDWLQAGVLLAPLVFVYAFVCLSSWYVCRANPIGRAQAWQALGSSALAAILAGALWTGLARLWIVALEATRFSAVAEQYRLQLPFLFAAGVLLFLLALAVHYVLWALDAARVAERRRLELEVSSREAELRALRTQLDPHFLYNSLNSISALTASDAAGARQMCLLLASFLRDTVDLGGRARISLAEELALAEHFLKIEQVRFGSRLRFESQIDDTAREGLVPPLLLQPLVENAITHGIAGMLEGGLIRLSVDRNGDMLTVAIDNPRDPDAKPRRARSGRLATRLGVGLDNVRKRLEGTFGHAARLDVHATPDGFHVGLTFPWVSP